MLVENKIRDLAGRAQQWMPFTEQTRQLKTFGETYGNEQ
jgi:hypothetical protein